MTPLDQDLTIRQGSSYHFTLRWQSERLAYRAITAVAASAPVRITVPGHNLTPGWPVAITGVKGMTKLNVESLPPKPRDFLPADVIDADTIELNAIDASAWPAYQSGGQVRYHQPVDMAGYTARMHVRSKITDPVPLLILTTENGGVTVDNTAKVVRLYLTPEQTAALVWRSGIYSLELVSPAGEVYTVMLGKVAVEQETTR